MENFIRSTRLQSLLVGLVFCIPLIGGCQKNELGNESNTILLSEIPENPAFASLPLIGTKWKLVGFADEETGKIKLAEFYSESSFTLIVKEGGDLDGYTSTNSVFGRYTIENQQLLVVDFSNITEINELYDGRLYIEAMKKVFASEISSKGLALKYSEDRYLLFKPVE